MNLHWKIKNKTKKKIRSQKGGQKNTKTIKLYKGRQQKTIK